MLKVGELAARAGLTVRTLHHYDSIGLLRPSARSDAGYRLYDRDDVARLHRIQARRAFGMSLSDIGLYLDSPQGSPLAIVERQLAVLERQMLEAEHMRRQLQRLRTELAHGGQPDLSTWLHSLEQMMSVYEKYFTKDELDQLPMYHDDGVKARWKALVDEAASLMRSAPPDADAPRDLARRWLDAFERNGDRWSSGCARPCSSIRRRPARVRASWRATGWRCSMTWSAPTPRRSPPSAMPARQNRCCAWGTGSARRCWNGCSRRCRRWRRPEARVCHLSKNVVPAKAGTHTE